MAKLWSTVDNKNLLGSVYVLQLVLNIIWNPVFFYYQNAILGLIVITLLTSLIGFILIYYYYPVAILKSMLIIPYFLWLLIATSLNLFILVKN